MRVFIFNILLPPNIKQAIDILSVVNMNIEMVFKMFYLELHLECC